MCVYCDSLIFWYHDGVIYSWWHSKSQPKYGYAVKLALSLDHRHLSMENRCDEDSGGSDCSIFCESLTLTRHWHDYGE
jgi:hypothetical protein